MRLKKMARWPPSTAGIERRLGQRGRRTRRLRGVVGGTPLTNEDGLSHAIRQGTGAQQQLKRGADAAGPRRQPPRQVLQVLRHGRPATAPAGKDTGRSDRCGAPAGNRGAGSAPAAPSLPQHSPSGEASTAFRKRVRPEPDRGRAPAPSWVAAAGRAGPGRGRWGRVTKWRRPGGHVGMRRRKMKGTRWSASGPVGSGGSWSCWRGRAWRP